MPEYFIVNLQDGLRKIYFHDGNHLWDSVYEDCIMHFDIPMISSGVVFDVHHFKKTTDPWYWVKGVRAVLDFWLHKYQHETENIFFEFDNYTFHNNSECGCGGECKQPTQYNVVTDFISTSRYTFGHKLSYTPFNYKGLLSLHLWLAWQWESMFPSIKLWLWMTCAPQPCARHVLFLTCACTLYVWIWASFCNKHWKLYSLYLLILSTSLRTYT